MMEQKNWLWRKRSSEKAIVTNGDDEIQSFPNEKELDLEKSLKSLDEKLASVVDECSAKDKLVQDYEKQAEDASADKHKAEDEVRRLKHELDEAHKEKVAADERLGHLNSALKGCMEQLKESNEFEKSHKKLEQKLSETSKKLASLTAENSYLSKALLVKEKLIDNLNVAKFQKQAEFEALMTRLDSIEKENAFLRYEFRSLENELDRRNEEMEYGYKQNAENVKKIKKLEAECQRLRVLTRKRMPAPGVLANIKSDIEVHGKNQINTRRKALPRPDNAGNLLMDRMRDLEKENEILKESLAKKEDEISYHRKFKNFSDQQSFASSRSWATALVSEHEHDKFTNDSQTENECKPIGACSEMSLMDDFVEMEKLAIVAIDTPKEITKRKDWIRDVTNIITEQQDITKRGVDEIIGDIKLALDGIFSPDQSNKSPPISGYITWKSPASSPRSSSLRDSNDEFSRSDMNRSITKIIELVRKFDVSPSKVADYKIHVFGCKSSEFTNVLQELTNSCYNLLDGKINFEKFTSDLASILEWIIGNSISHQDHHPTVRDEFRKHLGGDGPGTAFGLESVQNLMHEMEKMRSILQVEIERLKNELSLIKSSDESQQRTNEDQISDLKMINVDLDTQLIVTRAKLNDVLQKLSSVEVELENKSHCCEELEGTCLELQLQLASNRGNHNSEESENQEELLQTGMEITKASVKLAECEQTIMKLGKQLKSLGSPNELPAVDNVISITDTNNKTLKQQRSSLRDHMICDDNAEINNLQSPKTKEIISTTNGSAPPVGFNDVFSFPDGQEVKTPKPCVGIKSANIGALVVVPSKKRIGFLRKLMLRRRKF